MILKQGKEENMNEEENVGGVKERRKKNTTNEIEKKKSMEGNKIDKNIMRTQRNKVNQK